MKVVQINAVSGAGSTGKICTAVAELLDQNGVENYIFYGCGKTSDLHSIGFLTKWSVKLQALCSRVFGNYGFNTIFETIRMLRDLDNISPDIVHLHNLHGHNVNLRLLFRYLKKHSKIKIYWTFHDCWAFTGYCTHFTLDKCNKWMNGCQKCVQRKKFSWFFDRSRTLYRRKKELLSGLNMTIVTPSEWLAGLVKESFLKAYPVKTINNGINLSIFRPTASDFRAKYSIPNNKFILLGVAFGWDISKGLDVFFELAHRLQDDYQIVLVGTNREVDQILPKNIISIPRTKNQTELAEIYSAADLFINPTREENYPTVNMEAIACGTPVLTFRTGGSPEIVTDSCGLVVECDDVESLINCIIDVRTSNRFAVSDCIKRAKDFDANSRFEDYIKLYNIRMEDKK